MAKTKAEIRNRALVMLGKLPLGQTPTSLLADDMEDVYDQVFADLNSRGLVTWSSTDSVPDEFVDQIASLMAVRRSEGIPNDRYARIAAAAAGAIQSISRIIEGKWVNQREYADY